MKHIFREQGPEPVSYKQSVGKKHFLLGGSLESALVTEHQAELTHAAAFELLYSKEGRSVMKQYHEPYLLMAEFHNMTYILETPTWRANPDWIFKLGYNADETATVNRHAVQFIYEIQHSRKNDLIISGSVGPRRDKYSSEFVMTSDKAAQYHTEQIRTFALLDVDLISAQGFNYSDEAIGVVKAARAFGVPAVVSFAINSEGQLPNGESLEDAINRVDQSTQEYTKYYMVHCSRHEVIYQTAQRPGNWKNRVAGIRTSSVGQTTPFSSSELLEIKQQLPNLQIVGVCGIDFSQLDGLCRQLSSE